MSVSERISVLGVGFDSVTLPEAIDIAYGFAQGNETCRIVTPNSEIVYMARDDEALKNILNSSDLVIPDGIGVVYASKILKTPLKGKVAGIELGEGLISRLSDGSAGIFLLGAKPGIADLAAEKLSEKYPGIVISGTADGYFKDSDAVIEKINASGAKVLFVCLGAPKQEMWMAENAEKLNVSLTLGLGGSLDVFAGTVERAPKIFIKLGLEWFYRLCKEPWRIGRMMSLPKFLLTVIFKGRKG